MKTTKLVIVDRAECDYLGNSLDLAGGRVLRTPVTYWRGDGWDMRTFSEDRLAVAPSDWLIGRPVTSAMLSTLRAALGAYTGEDGIDEDLADLATYGY